MAKIDDLKKFTKSRFDIQIDEFNPFTHSYYDTNTGNLVLGGKSILGGSDMLKNNLIHENAHKLRPFDVENPHLAKGHGSIGYFESIEQSGKFHINYRVTAKGIGHNRQFLPYQNQSWKAYGLKKWFSILPKRF